MNAPGCGPHEAWAKGVDVEWLVGAHNGARNLATGFVVFQPSAELPLHRHHVEESITLLQGRAKVEIEGRTHVLGPMDNLVIPGGVAHQVTNVDGADTARFHVAYPIATVTTSLATGSTSARPTGKSRVERLNSAAAAAKPGASLNPAFTHFFSEELTPGVRMCGGYAAFLRGGRLPAHLHDCDESICIVQGLATCWVEGRKYQLSDFATALQPRGRVHYFINEVDQPMAMLWVYAAPTADRVVVDERCAVEIGVAWPDLAARKPRR
jgi:quercetin dioxygenase-like cupin family protein